MIANRESKLTSFSVRKARTEEKEVKPHM